MNIKECPFCGGKANLWVETENNYLNAAVVCEDCGSNMEDSDDSSNPNQILIDKVIERWNTRK